MCRTETPTLEDVDTAFKTLKNNKTSGPDKVTNELMKALQEHGREIIVHLLGEWWNNEHIPEQILEARVVHLFKKGNTAIYENYRPISLLNVLYKIYASIIQNRLTEGLEKHMHSTQYGFRQKKAPSMHYKS